jgi:hypothetical protein
MAPGGKDRAPSPILSVSTVATTAADSATVMASKVPVLEISKPEPFTGFRQRFKAFCTQVRLYIWADGKRPAEKRIIRWTDEQTLWAASFLRGDAYLRMEPYITARLNAGSNTACTEEVRKVITNIDGFLGVLAQSYGDLDEVRTSELQLIELKQSASVPEYLTRFTQYSSRVYWDERAKMAQFYQGLRPNIKDAMAIQGFPPN